MIFSCFVQVGSSPFLHPHTFDNHTNLPRMPRLRPLWLQVSVMCPLFHPRIMCVRSGLGKFINRATAPDPDRRTALPGASRYRFSTTPIRPLRKGGTAPNVWRQTTTTGGRPAHRGRGRRYGFGGRNRRTVFHLCFLPWCVLFFWLPRRRVWGGYHRARSWVLHVHGRLKSAPP